MQRYLIAALLLSALSLTSVQPAAAQAYRTAAGWEAGVFLPTSLNDGAVGADLLDLKPDMTWITSVHYDHWLGGGNIGIRARAGFSKPTLPWVQGDREITVYMGDVGLLLRPIAPGPGKSVLPFLGAGVGFIRWGLGDGLATTFDPAGVTYAGEEAFELVATPSLGIDIVTPWRWGDGPLVVRLEATDYIQFSSPFDPADPSDAEFGMIHNAAVLIGFHTGMGILGGGY